MKVIGVKTRVMRPPKDDLYEVMEESVKDVRDGDVVLVSSKVMAIHQGRCIAVSEASKEELVERESERMFAYYNNAYGKRFRLTLKGHTLVSAGGLDESNGDGHYILWPEEIIDFCSEIRTWIQKQFGVGQVAVIAVDSHSLPLRYGAMGISIGYFGMKPLKRYQGKSDLFGRPFEVERSNMVDMIAAAGTLVMGEGSECAPLAIVRDVLGIEFTDHDTSNELFIPIEEDMYWPLLKVLQEKEM